MKNLIRNFPLLTVLGMAAFGGAVYGFVGYLPDSVVYQAQDGEEWPAVQLTATLVRPDGSPWQSPVAVDVSWEDSVPAISSRVAYPDSFGKISVNFFLNPDPSSFAYRVTLWESLNVPEQSKELLFADPTEQHACFHTNVTVVRDVTTDCRFLNLGLSTMAMPPGVATVTFSPSAPEDICLESGIVSHGPIDSLMEPEYTATVPMGTASTQLYSWSLENAWNLMARRAENLSEVLGMKTIRRSGTAGISLGLPGLVSGSVDRTAYPNAEFIGIRSPDESLTDSSLTDSVSLIYVIDAMGGDDFGRIEPNGDFGPLNVSAGQSYIELWATSATGVPIRVLDQPFIASSGPSTITVD